MRLVTTRRTRIVLREPGPRPPCSTAALAGDVMTMRPRPYKIGSSARHARPRQAGERSLASHAEIYRRPTRPGAKLRASPNLEAAGAQCAWMLS
jgi:hypothetical protein